MLYRASTNYVYPPKCGKCDKFGKIEYITPLGRKASESCLCRESKVMYRPAEFVRYEFRLNRDKNGMVVWYRQYSDDEDGLTWDNSIKLEDVYSPDTKFEDIKSYSSTFFKTEEECQAYCDYLNSKN